MVMILQNGATPNRFIKALVNWYRIIDLMHFLGRRAPKMLAAIHAQMWGHISCGRAWPRKPFGPSRVHLEQLPLRGRCLNDGMMRVVWWRGKKRQELVAWAGGFYF